MSADERDTPASSATPRARPIELLAWSVRCLDEVAMFPSAQASDRAIVEIGRGARWRDIAFGVGAMAGPECGVEIDREAATMLDADRA